MTAASLTLPGLPPALADELRINEACPPTAANFREAAAAYARATADWYRARDLADIVRVSPDDESYEDDLATGVKYRAATVEGGRVLAAWQRARAELLAAVGVRRAELGRGRRA